MATAKLSIKAVLKESQETFTRNLPLCLALGVLMVVGGLLLQTISGFLEDNNVALISPVWGLFTWLVQLYGGLIVLKTMIRLSTGETVDLRQWKSLLVTEPKELLRYFLVSLIYGIIVLVGTLLLIIPGIILGIRYMFATYVAVDQQTKVKEALRQSSVLTKGNGWKLFGMSLLLILINIVGVMLFGLGLIVTIPFTAIAGAVAYRQLQDEPEREVKPVAIPTPTPTFSPYQI